ncbi:hypothetical protein [Brevibacillus dissolubilis]|uniref:hypothetical protein n=1 Tax=Brevibacillus dissolubilis TaxID=1844116 RepID=UPI0011179193|nr:hypothetical protein [Brevibacillus dissolubilis]
MNQGTISLFGNELELNYNFDPQNLTAVVGLSVIGVTVLQHQVTVDQPLKINPTINGFDKLDLVVSINKYPNGTNCLHAKWDLPAEGIQGDRDIVCC